MMEYSDIKRLETEVHAGGPGWWFDDPSITIAPCGTKSIISGCLCFSQGYEDEPLEDTFDIKIDFPHNYPEILPKVFETKSRIPKTADYHNSEKSGLCLATIAGVRQKISEGRKTFTDFISDLAIPFLFGHSYKEKKGEYPWPPARHEFNGIIDEYKQYFNIPDDSIVKFLIGVFGGETPIKGHLPCPCASGKKFRDCHMSKYVERTKYYSHKDMKKEFDENVKSLRQDQQHESSLRATILRR